MSRKFRWLIGTLFVVAFALEAHAFTADYYIAGNKVSSGNHEAITREALVFLRPSVLDDIVDEHEGWADDDTASSVKWVHMDGCAFNESVQQINAFYDNAVVNLAPGAAFEPWSATDDFGRVLHPAQDFYSHSNWVELGFPAHDDPATSSIEVSSADLVDFSTRLAEPNGLGHWQGLPPLGEVRRDIVSADMVDVPIRDVDGVGALDPYDFNHDGHVDIDDVTVTQLPAEWNIGLLPHPTTAGAAGFVPGIDTDGNSVFAHITPELGSFLVPVIESGSEKRFLISGVGDRLNPSIYINQCDPFARDANGAVIEGQLSSCRAPTCADAFGVSMSCPDDYSCIAYYGSSFALSHSGTSRSALNKDESRSSDATDMRYPKARALAVLQSQYEWCRFVDLLGRVGGDGPALSLWVREGLSANPAGTPCASDGSEGPLGVVITVEHVVVLDDKDDADDITGGINLSLAVYDDPFHFHRLSKLRVGPFSVHDGAVFPQNPAPITQCVNTSDGTLRVALHGWDDDEGANGQFNQNGSSPGGANVDDALIGFSEMLRATDIPIGTPLVREIESHDLRVRYRASRAPDLDADGLDQCGEAYYGTDPSNRDTDADGLPDGLEIDGPNSTNPLIADSDGDGLRDGAEDANANGEIDLGETDPNDVDTDRDLLTDGVEVLGSNPTDPVDPDSDDDSLSDGAEDANHNGALDATETNPNDADSDADQLDDGQELELGTDPLDADSDGDGLIDGLDGDWLAAAVLDLPVSAFKSASHGNRTALLNALRNADKQLKAGKLDNARSELLHARSRLDGCGSAPDNDDWIVDCTAQAQIRDLLDLLLGNL